MQTRSGRIALVFSVISLIVGLLLIFWHNTVLTVLLGIYMIVYPLIGILAASDKMAQLRTELPKMILGVVLLLVGPQKSLTLLFDVVGWIIISLTLVYTVLMLLGSRKGKKHLNRTGGRIFVDTTGDGKIDTVYVDTTGDGRVDTATQYREDK